ncbi:protein kinase domain-containing protein [Streptomyces justiciae]|uniref:protein kinase domain-containing protein n=1 Tax=Streptomyces justiciae TaxID=2780140 RepID=UPI0018808CFA|nr:serine/threonine-protein kinase [Streptomyces justiciae]MBE8472832.1 PQQ-binding-like beta-propeller repeat protein [Streptomyces justiciae]
MQALRTTDPRRVGPYEVRGRLGSGGMGEVYLAESRTGLRLAVKVVRAEYAQDRTFRARFRQEVRAAQTVGGAGTYTARVVDADPEGEHPWMATEFVEGPNLRDAVLDGGPLPEPAVRVLVAALGEALGAIHARGMVHRDLKPSNILLAPDGPRVIDFGIVRALEATAMTRTGAIVGSVGYVSPEQIRNGGKVGPPSDVFSLGAVLAYAASGREPFGEGQDSVILLRILTRDFDLTGVPEELLPLVEACLREEPGQRPMPKDVVEAVGGSPRGGLRPGWYTAAGPQPEASQGDELWLPERESGERESRVEYVTPVAETPVPEVLTPPVRPSRRGLLRLAVGGAVVAGAGGVGGWWWLGRSETGGDGGAKNGSAKTPGFVARKAAVSWTYEDGGAPNVDGGPCGVLSADGRTLYFVGADGTLTALGSDGEKRWEVSLFEGESFVTRPVVTAAGIFVAVVSDTETEPGRLVAVSAEGQEMWKRDLPSPYFRQPAVFGDTVVVGSAVRTSDGPGVVQAYDSRGKVRWYASLDGAPYEELVVAGDVLYVPCYDNHLYGIREGGATPFDAPLDGDVSRPAAGGKTVVVSTGNQANDLFGLDLAGREKWTKPGLAGSYVPAKTASFAFLGVTNANATLNAITEDGDVVWTYGGNGALSDPVLVDSTVYVRSDTEVHALDLQGNRLWKTDVGPDPGVLLTPVVHGRRVYAGTNKGVAALDVSG